MNKVFGKETKTVREKLAFSASCFYFFTQTCQEKQKSELLHLPKQVHNLSRWVQFKYKVGIRMLFKHVGIFKYIVFEHVACNDFILYMHEIIGSYLNNQS